MSAKTMLDVWRAMRAEYEAMTPADRRAHDTETRVALNYVASSTKAPGTGYRPPAGTRYT